MIENEGTHPSESLVSIPPRLRLIDDFLEASLGGPAFFLIAAGLGAVSLPAAETLVS